MPDVNLGTVALVGHVTFHSQTEPVYNIGTVAFTGTGSFDVVAGGLTTDSGAGDTGTSPPSTAGQAEGGLQLRLSGKFLLTSPVSPWAASSSLDLRVLQRTEVTLPEPAIIAGRPWVPSYWIRPDSAITLTQGSGHIEVIPDPDPVLQPGGATSPSSWPPASGTGGGKPDYWWTISDLATPPATGTRLASWPEHFGGPAWHSAGTYQPMLKNKVVFGKGGANHTYTKAVHFDVNNVEHMWIDLGASMPQPYTVLMVGIINSYPHRRYGHYLMDSGKPTPPKNTHYDWSIPDGSLSYRSVMLFQLSSALICSRMVVEQGVYAKCQHNYVPRPRMFIGRYDGTGSYVGYMDPKQKVLTRGRTDNNSVRYLVMGRRNGYVSDNLASHMTLFEIRIFKKALTAAEMTAQYKQAAATYKFNKYV